MSKKIPFLQMFAALCQWQELAEAVEGWVIVAALTRPAGAPW